MPATPGRMPIRAAWVWPLYRPIPVLDQGRRAVSEWLVKYDGPCARCGRTLARGVPAVWDRAARKMHCVECPREAIETPAPVIDPGVGGRSAGAEYERRTAKRDAAITERWGTGVTAKVVRALRTEPQTTRAWAIGAAGEEKLARELESVPDLQVLHDRRVPGTRANIDHIVIAPAGSSSLTRRTTGARSRSATAVGCSVRTTA